MTREEILAMQPGRELDFIVATKVMGWELGEQFIELSTGLSRGSKLFSPSTEISAAWQVLDKFRVYEITRSSVGEVDVTLFRKRQYGKSVAQECVPEAICKAALMAVMTQ